MIKIKDVEKKKLQIAYFLSRCKCEDNFSISSIYGQWCKWWKEDFLINGTFQPQIYKGELVLSKKGAQLGETQPECMTYYNDVLHRVQKEIIKHYDNNVGRKTNSDRFKKQMLHKRGKNLKKLIEALKERNVADKYFIENRTSKKHPCKLGLYAIRDKGKPNGIYYCSGTYETVLDYIENEISK